MAAMKKDDARRGIDEKLMTLGASRHSWRWVWANEAATEAARKCGWDHSDPRMQALLPVVCMLVLNKLTEEKAMAPVPPADPEVV